MRRKAFSLIELMIAIVVLSIASIGIYLFMDSSTRSWDTINLDTSIMDSMRHAAGIINLDLVQSNIGGTIQSGTYWDSLTFQTPVGFSAGATVWGAAGNAGWYYKYEVRTGADGMNTLHRVTYDGGNVQRDILTMLSGLPQTVDGQKAIEFAKYTYPQRRFVTTIRMEKNIVKQGPLKRTMTIVTVTRN